MRDESPMFSFTISASDPTSFIVIVCECFPGRVRTILTSRADKVDGKIRHCRRNKSECLETGVEWWTACKRLSSPFLFLSSLKLHAAVRNRIRYSSGVAPNRMGREVDATHTRARAHTHTHTHTHIYIYM